MKVATRELADGVTCLSNATEAGITSSKNQKTLKRQIPFYITSITNKLTK